MRLTLLVQYFHPNINNFIFLSLREYLYAYKMNNYKHILDIVNQHVDTIDNNWFTFEKKFIKEGKQGIVGLIKVDNKLCVYKTSRHLDFQMKHEALVMSSLNNVHNYCPFFCRSFGLIKHHADLNYKKKANPFKVETTKPIVQETLLIEYLPYKNLYEFIKDINISDKIILATIKQVLLAISIVQREKKFTHYDLHSCNILMKPCDKDKVNLFILDDENQIAIPTLGYEPKIIDFGFSYAEIMQGKPLYTSLAHTSVGFMSSLFDPIADLKLFLLTVSNELKLFRSSKIVNKFRIIVRNIFEPLNVDLESGWDERANEQVSASDAVLQVIDNIKQESYIFDKYNHYCIDQLQSLIVLPLKSKKKKDMEISYKMLTREISKIEQQISDSFTNLYILKNIILIASQLRSKYLNKETRKESIIQFQQQIQELFNSITNFCNPMINYEKLFCSLIVFTNCMKGILYSTIREQMRGKIKEYSHLKLTKPEHMIGVIEANIDEDYIYSTLTTITVLNVKNKCSQEFSLNEEQVDDINKLHSFFQGNYLNDIINE